VSDAFVGEIRIFAFNFAPTGWAMCNGQVLPISQNEALFALLGTFYGGDGITTFALPNLQSRVPIHQGAGAGLSTYEIGEAAGTENVTLSTSQMPAHSHAVQADAKHGTSGDPGTRVLAKSGAHVYSDQPDGSTVMNAGMLAESGGSEPHTNIQPYLVLNFCISLFGIFPSRD
jgi:microcystin-dependent protein